MKIPTNRSLLLSCLAILLQSCASSTANGLQDTAAPSPPPSSGDAQDVAEEAAESANAAEDVAELEIPPREPNHGHLPLGFNESGLCFGNSKRWNGIRVNFRDDGLERVRGINLTLWSPRKPGTGRVEGLALGVAPVSAQMHGVSLGLAASMAHRSMKGIQLGGLATVSEGELYGLSAGGLAVVSQGEMKGISVGGLAVVSEGDRRGASLAGLAVVSEGQQRGVGVAGLSVVSQGEQRGLNVAGLAVVAQGEQRGLNLAGLATVTDSNMTGGSAALLAVVAGNDLRGLGISGLATVSGGSLEGIGIAGLVVGDPDTDFLDFASSTPPNTKRDTSASGLMLAGYRVQANHVQGIAGALLVTRAHDLDGVAFAAYNGISGKQRGLSLGIFNYASELNGVQIGLLNYVGDNPAWARWLPLVNARF